MDYNSEVGFYLCTSRGLSKYFFEELFFSISIFSYCCPYWILLFMCRFILDHYREMAISISRKRIFNSCPPEIDLAPALLLTLATSWLIKDGGVSWEDVVKYSYGLWLWGTFTRVYNRAAVDSHWIVSAHYFRNWTLKTIFCLVKRRLLLAKFSLMGLFRIAGALTRGRALNRITVSKSQLSNVSFTLEILNVTSTEVT